MKEKHWTKVIFRVAILLLFCWDIFKRAQFTFQSLCCSTVTIVIVIGWTIVHPEFYRCCGGGLHTLWGTQEMRAWTTWEGHKCRGFCRVLAARWLFWVNAFPWANFCAKVLVQPPITVFLTNNIAFSAATGVGRFFTLGLRYEEEVCLFPSHNDTYLCCVKELCNHEYWCNCFSIPQPEKYIKPHTTLPHIKHLLSHS